MQWAFTMPLKTKMCYGLRYLTDDWTYQTHVVPYWFGDPESDEQTEQYL